MICVMNEQKRGVWSGRLFLIAIACVVVTAGLLGLFKTNDGRKTVSGEGMVMATSTTKDAVSAAKATGTEPIVELAVPFVAEAPDGNWTGAWKDACEESSMAMVDNFYRGKTSVSVADAKKYMQMLFDVEKKLYRSNMNSSSPQLTHLIDAYSDFSSTVKTDPTIEDIKKELDARHPVISLHRGAELKNKNVAFLASGSSYHVLVVTGYDDASREFITNDPGDRVAGEAHRYGYDLFMHSLHDYNYSNYMADGPARVLFTFPKKGTTI